MKIEFRDPRLALIRTDRAEETKLPFPVIKSCKEKLTVLEAAPDERILWQWKSLRCKKLEGDRKEQRAIRINDQYRLIFSLNNSQASPTITVLAVEDYH